MNAFIKSHGKRIQLGATTFQTIDSYLNSIQKMSYISQIYFKCSEFFKNSDFQFLRI